MNVEVLDGGFLMRNPFYVEFSVVPPVVAEPHRLPLQEQDYALLTDVGILVEVVAVVVEDRHMTNWLVVVEVEHVKNCIVVVKVFVVVFVKVDLD